MKFIARDRSISLMLLLGTRFFSELDIYPWLVQIIISYFILIMYSFVVRVDSRWKGTCSPSDHPNSRINNKKGTGFRVLFWVVTQYFSPHVTSCLEDEIMPASKLFEDGGQNASQKEIVQDKIPFAFGKSTIKNSPLINGFCIAYTTPCLC